MKKTFYELVVANPAGVEWYCSLKLEMAVHLIKRLLTQTMQSPSIPGLATVKRRIQEELQRKLGEAVEVDDIPDLLDMGCVDDFYASFEWSDGGLVHVHIAFWTIKLWYRRNARTTLWRSTLLPLMPLCFRKVRPPA